MTKWPVQKPTHRTLQKHVEHQDATGIKIVFVCVFPKIKICQVQHIDIVHLTTSYVKIVRLYLKKSLKYLELNTQIPT